MAPNATLGHTHKLHFSHTKLHLAHGKRTGRRRGGGEKSKGAKFAFTPAGKPLAGKFTGPDANKHVVSG